MHAYIHDFPLVLYKHVLITSSCNVMHCIIEIVPKEITSSANDPHTSTHIGKFLQSAISSKPSSTNGKNSSDELGGDAISGRRDRDIESLNMPFISTVDNSF